MTGMPSRAALNATLEDLALYEHQLFGLLHAAAGNPNVEEKARAILEIAAAAQHREKTGLLIRVRVTEMCAQIGNALNGIEDEANPFAGL